jgi:hypothetical protein
MKTAVLLSVAAFSFSTSALVAQQVAAGAQTSTSVDGGSAHVGQATDANASAVANRGGATLSGDAQSSAQMQMHPVNGELVGKLDAKTARTGDAVVVKTSQAFRTSEGIVVPKGSRLIGHVTEAQAHGNGYQDSRLGIEFDRAELKSGESLHLHSMIESVAPPANALATASMDSSEGVGAMGGGDGRSIGGRSGGGLLGGASAATSATAGVGSSLDHATGGSVGVASDLTSGAGAAVGNGLNGAAGTTGSLGAHATAIPGVMLESGASASASSVLSASKRNVHLESGSQMTLGVVGAMAR